VLSLALGRLPVRNVSGGAVTVMKKPCWPVAAAESVTLTTKLKVPVTVGVPEIVPPAGFSVKPVGKAPLIMLQVYGGVPPAATRFVAYGVPIWPLGRGLGKMDGCAWTGLASDRPKPVNRSMMGSRRTTMLRSNLLGEGLC